MRLYLMEVSNFSIYSVRVCSASQKLDVVVFDKICGMQQIHDSCGSSTAQKD